MYNIITNIIEVSDYKPIIEIDNKYIINFDKVDLMENETVKVNGKMVQTGNMVPTGKCIYSSFTCPNTLTVDEIVNKINELINNEVTYLIKNHFYWNGYNINLSSENQMNYKNAFDLAVATEGDSLPITFKFKKNGKNEYYTFDTVSELKDFYIKVNKYINECLQDGWGRKDAINPEDYKI